MNKHTKLALLIAPFLILGGYIASDLYIENEANKKRVFQLIPSGDCDIINQSCILKSKEFEVNIYDEAGVTKVNSTFPLDTATLFLVSKDNEVTAHPLGMTDNPYYWQSQTDLRQLTSEKDSTYTLRLIANIKGGQYISEFTTHTIK